MPPPNVSYSTTGGSLSLEIHIGYVIAAGYEVDLWAGNAKTKVADGVNDVATRAIPLSDPLPAYNGKVLAWDITLGQMAGGDDQYLVSVTIRQDNKTLFTHPWHDKFDKTKRLEIYGGVMLVAT